MREHLRKCPWVEGDFPGRRVLRLILDFQDRKNIADTFSGSLLILTGKS
jgi:hypothetical protein